MLGLSFRDLLCCCPKSGDGEDPRAVQSLPATSEGHLESKRAPEDSAAVRMVALSNEGGTADVKFDDDDNGDALRESAELESSNEPAAIQGAEDVAVDDDKGPMKLMGAWFSEKTGREGLETALQLTNLALKSASGVLGNLPVPVPGAVLSINIVLSIIGIVQTSIRNVETLNNLRNTLVSLSTAVLVPLSQQDALNSTELRKIIKDFQGHIDQRSKKLANWNSSSGVMRFLKAKIDEEELSEFSMGIEIAIRNFQLALNVGNAVTLDKLTKAFGEMKSKLDVCASTLENRFLKIYNLLYKMIERKIDLHRMDAQFEKLRQEGRIAVAEYLRKINCCHGETCKTILSIIKDWANSLDSEQSQIFWLSGRAGTGKSTIARTIAKWAREEGILGSEYYFSREGEKSLSEPLLLIPAIAYDVAEFDPSMKQHLAKVLDKNRSVMFTSEELEMQFQSLVAEPLVFSAPQSDAPRKLMLLIVDSLDECNSRTAITKIICLLNPLVQSNPHIRVLVTSRPESYIRDAFGDKSKRTLACICRNVEDSMDPQDIGNFLRDSLVQRYQTDFREKDDFKTLVKHSGNLFVYASTALRYICAGGDLTDAEERIADVLKFNNVAAPDDSWHRQLDQLYLGILERAIGDGKRIDSPAVVRLRRVLGTIMESNDPLPISALEELITTDEIPIKNLRNKLEGLSSVIVVPPPDEPCTPVRFFHQSFPDFLKVRERCTERFLIDVMDTDIFLSRRCLEVMVALLGNSRRHSESSALPYVCTNWAVNLAKTQHGDGQVKESLENFVQRCLYDWTRTMKTLLPKRYMQPLVLSLKAAREWARSSGCDKELLDAISSQFKSLIDEELPQVQGATYRSVSSTGRIEPCYPETRSALLKEVKDWMGMIDSKSIFWLCESGGTGKSAIAMSIAQWASEKGDLLGGSFFFDKQAPQCDLQSFISTIAHDIALYDPSKMESIAQVLDDRASSSWRSSDSIIANLLTVLDLRAPTLIIVDALDECKEEMAETIIGLLSALSKSKPYLRIFLTSRPEPHIEDAFLRADKRVFILHSIDTASDKPNELETTGVEAYLLAELSRIWVDVDWRERDDFKALLKYCGGLFIHAATALRYISNGDGDHNTCITNVLRLDTGTTTNESAHERLERFYFAILSEFFEDKSNVSSDEMMQKRRIVGMISELRDTLPVGGLVELLGEDETSLREKLKGLSCVIAIPSPDSPKTPVRFFHRSFSDFIQYQQRVENTGQFFIGVQDLEAFLARRCLEVMLVGLPGDSWESFSPGLQYTYKYWADHLVNARYGDSQVTTIFALFVQRCYLLKWFSINFLDLDHLTSTMKNVHNWVIKSKCSDELSRAVYEILQFVAFEKRVCRLREGSDNVRRRNLNVCYGETCKVILSKVKDWAASDVADDPPRMFWLIGLAGSGKSTIAKTIATWANKEGILSCVYFCTGENGVGSSKSSYLIPYIAYHISKLEPSLPEAITKALVEVGVLYQGVALQAHAQKSWPAVNSSYVAHGKDTCQKPLLIIIDALNECDDGPTAVPTILRFLSMFATLHPHIRIFFSSRREQHIQSALDEIVELNRRPSAPVLVHCSVEDFVETNDIKEYLHHELIEYDWPSMDDLNLLVARCGRLFVSASTASRFIREGLAFESHMDRLKILLGIGAGRVSDDMPYKRLDDIYLCILNEAVRSATSKSTERLRRILGAMILLHAPQSIDSLAKILEEDRGHTETALRNSGATSIITYNKYGPPYLHHVSLADFLTDAKRCTDDRFLINLNLANMETYLFHRSLDIIIEGLTAVSRTVLLDEGLREAMQYACRHWVSHLEKTHHTDAWVAMRFCAFVRHYLLKWIKVTKDLLSEADAGDSLALTSDLISAMEVARKWAALAECNEEILHTIDNATRSSYLLHAHLLESDGTFTYNSAKFRFRDRRKIVVLSRFPGTRMRGLKEVKKWTTDLKTTEPNIFWMRGLPMSGKTSTAMSVADWANGKGIFSGSLFSKRTDKVHNALSAIVHEMASIDASIGGLIVDAIEKDENMANRRLDVQFKQLIAEPLRLVKLDATFRAPLLFILDVLDKCQKEEAIELLQLFLTCISGPEYSHIRILVASRPEPHISNIFKQYEQFHRSLNLSKMPAMGVRKENICRSPDVARGPAACFDS